MNLAERYKKLRAKANRLLQEGFLNEYIRILNELVQVEKQLTKSVKWN